MRSLYVIFLTVFSFHLISCKHCNDEYCQDFETITVDYVNYSPSESDSILIKRYIVNTNFTQLHDSIWAQDAYYENNTMHVQYVDRQGVYNTESNTEYDLEVINPFDHKAIKIADILRKFNTQEVCKGGLFNANRDQIQCNNTLLNFTYAINLGSIQSNGNTIFVTK